jgi:transcriptional regulator with XRE-family HTH domain
MVTLGEKLKKAREDAGLEQKTVAAELNLDQGKISLIERGARKVDAEKELPKFAKLYKKPINWFFEEDKEVPEGKSEIDDFLKTYLPDVNFSDFEKKRLSQFLGNVAESYVKTVKTDPELKKKVNEK